MLDRCFEYSSVKQTIVSMIMQVCDTVGECQFIVGLFSLNCRLNIHDSHQMNVSKVRKMINEDCDSNVSLFGREAAVNGDEAKSRADDLVHTDDLAWSSSLPNFLEITNAIAAPW